MAPEVIEPRNLYKWQVNVNGVEISNLRLEWKDGKIRLGYRPGAIMIVW